MEDFLKQLADAINQPDLAIQPDHKLKELPNWDSLAILTTLSMMDQEYGITMSGAELQSCDSVADLYARVKEGRS
ncbi:MAG: acyl carrier protein [Oceanipulchritudo sp.]|jgi:acyl carrier protein